MAISVDATSDSGDTLASSSITFAHSCGTLTNGGLVVVTQARDSTTGTDRPVTGITYNSVALTLAKRQDEPASDDLTTEIWYLKNPASGTHNIVVSFTGIVDVGNASGISLEGFSQTSPLKATGGDQNTLITSLSVNIASDSGGIVIDSLYTTDNNLTIGAGQTQIAKHAVNSGGDFIGDSYELGDGNTRTMSWTWTGANGTTACLAVASFSPAVISNINNSFMTTNTRFWG